MSEHADHAGHADDAGQGGQGARPRPNNLRTALWLAALALSFFVLLFVKRIWMN